MKTNCKNVQTTADAIKMSGFSVGKADCFVSLSLRFTHQCDCSRETSSSSTEKSIFSDYSSMHASAFSPFFARQYRPNFVDVVSLIICQQRKLCSPRASSHCGLDTIVNHACRYRLKRFPL